MSKRPRLSDHSFVFIGSSWKCRNKDDVVQEDGHDSDVEDRKLTGCFISICTLISNLSLQVASSFLSAFSHLSFCQIFKRRNEIVMPSNKDDVVQEDSDGFRIFEFRAKKSVRARSDNRKARPYVLPSKKACRLDPRKYHYSGSPCPDFPKGDGVFEFWLHPARYRTQPCEDGIHCRRRVCFFAHTLEELRLLPHCSNRQTILKLFEQMMEWRRRTVTADGDPVEFNWTCFHLSILHSYVFKLGLDYNFRVLSFAKLFEDELWCLRSSTRDAWIVAPFAQELQEFFVVPKQHQLFQRDDNIKQHELMADLVNLLLQFLQDHVKVSINSFEDKIKRLEEVLRFLHTVLGDKSLICDEKHGQVQNLLAEIEAVAKEAGTLVHSLVFSTFDDPIFRTMDERLGVLLKHVEVLQASFIKFSKPQPAVTETNITPKTDAVNFLLIVDSLLYDLENLLSQEDDMISNVKDQIKVLQQKLKLSKSFIIGSQYSEMEELKDYVMRIRDAACEAEYLINSFLVGDAPHWYLSIRLSHVIQKIKLVETGIEETKKKYDDVVNSTLAKSFRAGLSLQNNRSFEEETKEKYDDVVTSTLAKSFSAKLSLQNKRSSEVDDIIVGFEDKTMDILDHLLGENKHRRIISIFGMPGLGKTTLAKKLYNHPSVKNHFDRCMWCVVSQTHHRKNLLIDILDGLKSEQDKVEILKMEEESIATRIYQSLKGRRYLIVMDDLWGSDAWNDLQRCFPDDLNGSRILITSRNKDVAPLNSIIYKLPFMSDEQCWELLERKVFQNEDCPPKLVEIGKRIATNCRGVPLAVVVVAGILSSMDKERITWENVEGNLASFIFSDQNSSMMQILELSYKYLPGHLKPYFLYFGAFPEDKQIPIRKLMRLWIAEGFIIREDKKSSQSLAEEYLMELINKSLVMVAKRRSDGSVKACVLHDLLRDFCLKRCEEENFLNLANENYSEKHRRLCVRSSESASLNLTLFYLRVRSSYGLLPICGLHVRSFFGFVPISSVLNMKLLRILDLQKIEHNCNLTEIKHLVHLRYLAIEYVSLSNGHLAWIGNLVNLEFLVLRTSCFLYIYIPSVMVKMLKLRYVKFTTRAYFCKGCDASQTNNLESLSCVFIENPKDEKMLKCSPHLRKLSCECRALWDEEKGTCRYPDFSFFTQLESLSMTLVNSVVRADTISLPLSIKKLTLSKLCLPWENMSIIGGLPNLQVLELLNRAFVGEVWETRDGEFQQLTFLKLSSLHLKQWNVPMSEHLPKLRQLVLCNCKYLQEIPSEINEIVTLQSIEVEGMSQDSLLESAREIEREQPDNGNEELGVIYRCIVQLAPRNDNGSQVL